ncbi:MUC3B protein, partial [Ibidorhyncha struthersii]|nr:MUC3B protein [Ibidorhyncha struthersii]
DPCQNGGRWTGTFCLCPPNVDGARCQFGASTINLTAELGPSILMLARVTNRNCSEDMGDTSSPTYRSFVDEFSRIMDHISHSVSGYRGTRVLTLTRGSVVVNYKVLLHPPAGGKPSASLDHRARELLEVANAAPQPRNCSHSTGRHQGSHRRSGLVPTSLVTSGDRSPLFPLPKGLCFSASSSRSAHAEMSVLNATELCRKHAPANFSQYYYPYRMQNSILCVTNCTLNVPGSIDCNSG